MVSNLLKQKYLHLMILPFVVLVFFMCYLPMLGLVMAFKDFTPHLGIFASPWVGLKYFEDFFLSGDFVKILRNTLAMSGLNILFGFPLPIAFALLLNELKFPRLKKFVQTSSYLPHFISWVIAANLIMTFLSYSGTMNAILLKLRMIQEPVAFFQQGELFWLIVTLGNLWKELGWSAIIYLAAIAGVDTQLYDAAYIDGAGRFRRIWHVTLPSIRFTIIFVLIFSISNLLNSGFEQQLLMGNPLILDYSDNIDTYTYRYGLAQAQYAYGTAIGLFKSIISFALLYTANWASKKYGGFGLW